MVEQVIERANRVVRVLQIMKDGASCDGKAKQIKYSKCEGEPFCFVFFTHGDCRCFLKSLQIRKKNIFGSGVLVEMPVPVLYEHIVPVKSE